MQSMVSQDNTKYESDMLSRILSCRIDLSEIMTIVVRFHRSEVRFMINRVRKVAQ